MNAPRLAIVETHPIQYKVPWFQRLEQSPEIQATVLYAMVPDASQQGDGFGVSFAWDVPMLEGYSWRELENVSATPSVTLFKGCDTPGLYGEISRQNYDVLLVNGWVAKSCLQALWAARRAGVPCIVRGESNDLRRRVWWKRMLQGVLVRRYAAALYIGAANREFYMSRGVPEDRLFFGPYCVDNDRFASVSASVDRPAARAKWSVPADAFCFLFSGKLQAKKRPMDVLLGLRMAAGQLSRPVHLLVVGDGDLRADCERVVAEHGLPVSFAGFLNQTELPSAYAAADCLVLPSDSGETWGLVVNEAMACGVPAIVSDEVGSSRDLVTDDETGWIFRCGDIPALASRMVRAVARAPGLRDACRSRLERYNYGELLRGTVDAVNAVCPLDRRRRR